MEQSTSRPPEKVVMMPSSSSSSSQTPGRTPSVNSKKATRGRSSLLSIISAGKQSPSTEEPPSTLTKDTAGADTSSSPKSPVKSSAPVKENQRLSLEVEASKPTKKTPPPTLAKTFKTKPSPTTETPASPVSVKTSVSEPLPEVEEPVHSEIVNTEISKSVEAEPQSPETSEVNANTDSKSPEPDTKGTTDVQLDNIFGEIEKDVASFESEEIKSEDVADTSQLPPPLDVELPPPIAADQQLDIDVSDSMDFPPPPEMDFSPEETTTPTAEDNSQRQEAVNKIEAKYEISSVSMNNMHLNNCVTQDANPNLSKQDVSTKDHGDDSMNIPSHTSNHTYISSSNSSNTTESVGNEVATDVAASPIAVAPDTGMHSEVTRTAKADVSFDLPVVPDQEPSISSDLSDSGLAEDEENISMKAPSTDPDNESITHLISPPTLPPTSTFSALDTNELKSTDDTITEESPASSTADAGEGKALTVSQHLEEDSSGISSAASPAAHSPPFNTSSESGDSGVESGVYTFVGETVQVKLRPTTNDNRKPDSSAPMFERNSTELKRVTFREAGSNPINPMVVNTRRTAAEEQRIKKTGLSEDDVAQAELFYKGHKTEVMVCPCLGTLYFAESNSSENIPVDEWKPEHIGIPVLIYDTGNGKRSRGLTMVFAEKGTGFLLWKTVINYESRWEVVEPVFHRLHIPGTADKFAGIAFQDEESAQSFYNFFKTCTSDPEKNVLNNPNLRNSKKKKEKKKSVKHKSSKTALPTKTAISMPAQFTHVTQLKQAQDGILAMAMIPAEEEEGSEEGPMR